MRFIIYKKEERIILLKSDLEIDDPYFADNITELEHNILELEDIYSDCQSSDFNEDLTFSVEKYNARKQQEKASQYEDLIVAEIRKKYNVNQELAILRQRDTKPIEFAEYNDYVEECKTKIKILLN